MDSKNQTLLDLTKPKLNDYIAENPSVAQAAFLMLDCSEVFFGGAAGPGKTSGLLMAALQYVDVPGYSAIIFRRTYKNLSRPGGLIPRSKEWLKNTDAVYREADHQWTFPSGATLTLGQLEHEDTKDDHSGAEYQFIGFDELTEFTETQYTFMFSRLRRPKDGPLSQVPLRMRSASNPGGEGHDWVKAYFVDEPGTDDRIFLPAVMEDNPGLDLEAYEKSLGHLDTVTRKRLREGDWEITAAGKKFQREWFKIVESVPVECMKWVRYWDLAATEAAEGKDPDWTAGGLLAFYEKLFYIADMVRIRGTPHTLDKILKQTAEADGKRVPIWIEREGGASGKIAITHYVTILAGFTLKADLKERKKGIKEIRANPVSSYAENGNVRMVRGPWNRDLLNELVMFPTKGVHDDQVDAISGGFAKLVGRPGIIDYYAELAKEVRDRKAKQEGTPGG